MIEFMVLTAPRSASTWTSNWLTTEKTVCVHEPLWHYHYNEIDDNLIYPGRTIGISETGLAKFPDFVNKHPARKIILHRDLKECSDSLVELGFKPLKYWEGVLENIEGKHYHYTDVFDPAKAKEIYEFLLEMPFDSIRHKLLCEIEMQPHFEGIKVTPQMKDAAAVLLKELRNSA